jgi:hypothetical protein
MKYITYATFIINQIFTFIISWYAVSKHFLLRFHPSLVDAVMVVYIAIGCLILCG